MIAIWMPRATTATITYSNCDSQTVTYDTWGPYDNWSEYYEITALAKELEEAIVIKKKPHFVRVMKMRNTEGQARLRPVWRPMRLVSRGNIGTRNFKANHTGRL
jgi:hypothetical protein